MTECKAERFGFHALGGREVVGEFDGGDITTDAGGVILREVEKRTGIIGGFAACFTDHRKPELIEHPVEDLIGQRIYGLCLGYEDLNDHDELRSDPMIAVMVGKKDPKGETRRSARDRGNALAGKSTLNRLELTRADASARERYKKIVMDPDAVDRWMVDVFLDAHDKAPGHITLDLDATDDPVHGTQEGRFFHGYYGHYCYLPLYIFCGKHLLGARLRRADIDASEGALDELERIVAQIRSRWPKVHILVRADSGFCRDEILAWCERNGVDYVIGLARNNRLSQEIQPELEKASEEFQKTGEAARVYRDFRYRTLDSWSQSRRVIGKAEHLAKGPNPRFVVTSLPRRQFPAAPVYEVLYCGRGDMENRIKEQQLALFADRTSTATMRANQLRLYFSSAAYILMQALRQLGLEGTELAQAQCDTIRLKLLRIGAQIQVTVRRVWIHMAGGYPYRNVFRQVWNNLQKIPLRC
jgi:hypothetical protein